MLVGGWFTPVTSIGARPRECPTHLAIEEHARAVDVKRPRGRLGAPDASPRACPECEPLEGMNQDPV
jgi:hypothetical protein